MDNLRLILIVALTFILMLMYQSWQEDYGPDPTQPSVASTPTSETPNTPNTSTPTPPDSELPTTQNDLPTTPAMLPVAQQAKLLQSDLRIQVETDVLKLEIDTTGGDVRLVDLLGYPVQADKPDEPFRLMGDELPNLFVAQSGLLPKDAGPTHQAVYQSDQQNYRLSDGADDLEVKLYWQNDKGIKVSKIFTFQRGSYVIGVKHLIENNSAEPWQGRLYGQFQRTEADLGGSRFLYTYMGGAISSPEQRYEKISFDEIRDGSFNDEGRQGWANGWVAMLQHYFVGAWVPERDQLYSYYTNMLPTGNRYILGLYGPTQTVASDSQHVFEMALYAGPKVKINWQNWPRDLI
jgi:YidC/Oxa1 family membrane protein insertase